MDATKRLPLSLCVPKLTLRHNTAPRRLLAPEQMEQLFKAFYTTKPGGMGMGLAISRSIIEAHGGRLWAEPNMPRGAIFQFTLPRDDESGA